MCALLRLQLQYLTHDEVLSTALKELVRHVARHLLQLLGRAEVLDRLEHDATVELDAITLELFFALRLDAVSLLLIEVFIALGYFEVDR